jgi:hypothetical protein
MGRPPGMMACSASKSSFAKWKPRPARRQPAGDGGRGHLPGKTLGIRPAILAVLWAVAQEHFTKMVLSGSAPRESGWGGLGQRSRSGRGKVQPKRPHIQGLAVGSILMSSSETIASAARSTIAGTNRGSRTASRRGMWPCSTSRSILSIAVLYRPHHIHADRCGPPFSELFTL